MSNQWSPSSWRSKPIAQIERLRYQLGLVQRNEAFLLHAGDCAESFDACTHNPLSSGRFGFAGEYLLENRFDLVVLLDPHLGRSSSCCRIAGQYAKPRSSSTEKIDGREVLSFRTEFEKIVDGLSDALDFSRTIGMDSSVSYEQGGGRGTLGEVDFYTRQVLTSSSSPRFGVLYLSSTTTSVSFNWRAPHCEV
ncbi:hypothetical protein CC1G_14057 [Coprinopsis cinerea okayama7|uniref:Phospho-2-dehydro-3-deoxyheptonate aldolase n=1 Tax=Coprinopsis cinerea (strain Okayama-7 / 130 / ATCC MYA-4618 / FGSC 9003) TaxID=240176 RepID=D6RL31_COPC7|nr:hypothetical protein CC1G_14057 [Coprinopsis cinerea okayama7\|eukprot:XP_002911526.1 hypothetical protein CC1G_14057 [Coprinopsis cinerea okayama7\